MKDRKLIRLLTLLSETEFERFIQYIHSPFFNTNKRIRALGDFLAGHYPSFDADELTPENTWEAIAPGEQYSRSQLGVYLSRCLFLVEDFLFQLEVQDKVLQKENARSTFYLKKKADTFLGKLLSNRAKLFAKKNPKNIDDYYWEYQLMLTDYNYQVSSTKKPEFQLIFQNLHSKLDQYYSIEKIRLAVLEIALGRSSWYRNPQQLLTTESQNYLAANFEEIPLLGKLWFLVFQLCANPEDKVRYSAVKDFFIEHINSITPNDGLGISTILERHIRILFSKDRRVLMGEIHTMNKLVAESGWFFSEKVIHHIRFNSIVFAALYLGYSDWAHEFIVTHIKHVFPAYRDTIKQYNLARIDFAQKNYKACLKKTLLLDNIDFSVNIGTKRLQLKSYFELGEYEVLEASLNTFRVYVHRIKESSEAFKAHHNNFASILATIYRYKLGDSDSSKIEAVREQLEADSRIPEHDWLLEKVNEL